MYSFPDLKLVCCSMFNSNCSFLTCIQISQEAGQVVWYSHLLKNYPQFVVLHTVKGFCIVNKIKVYVFLELSCFFNDPMMLVIWSFSTAFSKTSLNIWNFTVHVLLKPGLENCEHYFDSIVRWVQLGDSLNFHWHCLSFWNENWPFPVMWPLLSFPNFLA